jgi:DNA-binding CsgD family transcriptional regulator
MLDALVSVRAAVGTPLFGRTAALEAVVRALTHVRRVTIAGPRGAGKTRLALEALAVLGINAVDRVPVSPDTPWPHLLRVRKDGVVLFEVTQLTPAFEHRLDQWLATRPRIKALVTVERVPASGCDVHLGALDSESARGLFHERMRRANPHATGLADDITAICKRLDHLPGLLETAAGLVAHIPIALIREHLSSGEPLETLLTEPQRRRFAWGSVALERLRGELTATTWAHLSRLSVFERGFSLSSATLLHGQGEEFALLEQLDHLVEWGVIQVDRGGVLGYHLAHQVRAHLRVTASVTLERTEALERWTRCCVERSRTASTHPYEALEDPEVRVGIDALDLEAAVRRLLRAGRFEEALDVVLVWRAIFVRGGRGPALRRTVEAMLREGRWTEADRLRLFVCLGTTFEATSATADLATLCIEGVAAARRVGDVRAEAHFRASLTAASAHASAKPSAISGRALNVARPLSSISLRDEPLVRRLLFGETHRQIAEALNLSEGVLTRRLAALYTRYGCRSRAELVRMVLERRLLAFE